jgi:hypothetical protein
MLTNSKGILGLVKGTLGSAGVSNSGKNCVDLVGYGEMALVISNGNESRSVTEDILEHCSNGVCDAKASSVGKVGRASNQLTKAWVLSYHISDEASPVIGLMAHVSLNQTFNKVSNTEKVPFRVAAFGTDSDPRVENCVWLLGVSGR